MSGPAVLADGLLHGAATQAARADPLALRAATGHADADTLEVGFPVAVGQVVSVGHVVSKDRLLSADFTHARHHEPHCLRGIDIREDTPDAGYLRVGEARMLARIEKGPPGATGPPRGGAIRPP